MTAPASCPACHAALTAGAKYCHRCGRSTVAAGAPERTPWIIAGVLVVVALGGITYFVLTKDSNPARPDMANVGAAPGSADPSSGSARPGTPPDISRMTPRDRFMRLSERIMSSMSAGDTAAALNFVPMAITAYGMLERPDPDLRFFAGSIHARMGQYAEALALADTIQAEARDHLFADMLRADVAQARGDRAALGRSRRAFLSHLDQQLASRRPEYEEYRALIDEFRKQAQ